MRVLPFVLVTACAAPSHPPAPAPPPLPSPATVLPPATFVKTPVPLEKDDRVTFVLHKFLAELGVERDTYVPVPGGGVEAKAVFSFRDRGQTVPLAASIVIGADGRIRHYAAWGFTSRFTTIDDRVELGADGGYDVRHDATVRRVVPTAPFVVGSGYAPMLIQDLAFRAWDQQGRPAKLAVLPDGQLAIASRGKESYDRPAGKVTLEHLSVSGLVWGVEDAWLDDKGELAAVVARDAEFDHFEAARSGFEALLPALAASSGRDGVARLASSVAAKAGLIALVGATLIDGTGRPAVPDAVVVFDGDRIIAAGPRAKVTIPTGATTVDVTGKTIIPGLWDMHAHVEQVEQGSVYLAAGVTTVRDMGNILEFVTGMRDSIDAGTGLGPRILVSGIVDGGGELALGTIRIRTRDDIPRVIDRLRKAGALEVKLYSSIAPELVRPIVAYAHAHGMRAVGHVPIGVTVEQAIDAGYDSISHVRYLLDIYPATSGLTREEWMRQLASRDLAAPAMTRQIASLVSHHVAIDDTLTLYEGRFFTDAEYAKREPGVHTLPRELAAGLGGVPASLASDAAAAFAKHVELLRLLHDRGVTIMAGTDINVPGHSLHRELELYVLAGFTPMQAIQAATIVPARYAHLDKELGTVEAGKRADLVVIAGDPLVQIGAIRNTELVVAHGKVYDSMALWKLSGFTTIPR